MGLSETLKQIKRDAGKRLSPEALQRIEQTVAQLRMEGRLDAALAIGERMPSFALKDHDDVVISSQDLLAGAPLVLVFYRGVW